MGCLVKLFIFINLLFTSAMIFYFLDGRPFKIILLDTAITGSLYFYSLPDPDVDPEGWIVKMKELNELVIPAAVSSKFEDIKIPLDDFENNMRIFVPKGPPPENGYSLFIWLHGGGYCLGSYKANGDFLSELSEEWGQMVVSLGYRLAPKYKFPVAINDIYSSLKWIVKNPEKLQLDVNKIIVGGESAGAVMSSVMGLRSRDEKEFKIAGIYINSGTPQYNRSTSSKSKYSSGYVLSAKWVNAFSKLYVNKPEDWQHPYASLHNTNLKGMPPVLLHIPEMDVMCDSAVQFAEKLKQENGPEMVKYHIFPGVPHGGIVGVRNLFWAESREAMSGLLNWLEQIVPQQQKVQTEKEEF